MERFLPLQKEFEKIYYALTSQNLLTVDSVRQEPFLQVIDQSNYLITIHDVEYYRPICINEKLRKFYGFDNRILQGMDHFYYLKTVHHSTYYTLIESMAFFRNDYPGYLNLKYKLLESGGQWKKTIGASKAVIRNGRGGPKVAMTVMKPMEIEISISRYEQYLSLTPVSWKLSNCFTPVSAKKRLPANYLFLGVPSLRMLRTSTVSWV